MPEKRIAPAKINLSLRITGLREDGYHELDTVFLPLPAPHDVLEFEQCGSGLTLNCPGFPDLDADDNLIAKAYRAYGERTGFSPGVAVTLHKNIPMGAGLGGGSSDAACMLHWLNDNAGDNALAPADMNRLGAGIGADVPFFLLGKPARATGIGEKLVETDVDLRGLTLLLVCPDEHVNTAWAYAEWDRLNSLHNGDRQQSLTTSPTDNKNLRPVSGILVVNDFEEPVFPQFPTVRKIKETLLRHNAAAAAMSGSGASVFALYRNREDAESATKNFLDGHFHIHTF